MVALSPSFSLEAGASSGCITAASKPTQLHHFSIEAACKVLQVTNTNDFSHTYSRLVLKAMYSDMTFCTHSIPELKVVWFKKGIQCRSGSQSQVSLNIQCREKGVEKQSSFANSTRNRKRDATSGQEELTIAGHNKKLTLTSHISSELGRAHGGQARARSTSWKMSITVEGKCSP